MRLSDWERSSKSKQNRRNGIHEGERLHSLNSMLKCRSTTLEKDGNHKHAVEDCRDNISLEITDVQLKYDVLKDLEDQDSKEYQNDAREKRKGREGEEADIFKY